MQARYLSVRHQVNEYGDWRKVYMWELAAYPAGVWLGCAPCLLSQWCASPFPFLVSQPVADRLARLFCEAAEVLVTRNTVLSALLIASAGGRWGPPPQPVPRTETYRQILGVNGIWGWGSQMFSDTAVKQGKGPLLYNAVASSGRNYQARAHAAGRVLLATDSS